MQICGFWGKGVEREVVTLNSMMLWEQLRSDRDFADIES